MSKQRVPTSLRESIQEIHERMSSRTAILHYLRDIPPERRGGDHCIFVQRLDRELKELQIHLWVVLNDWRDGRLSAAIAANLLRMPFADIRN